MDRLTHRKGYALLELLISILLLAVLSTFCAGMSRFSSGAYYTFPDQYTRIRSEAILTGEKRNYEDDTDMDYPPISFSESGNINLARTLVFPRGSRTGEIILELGPGTLVFED